MLSKEKLVQRKKSRKKKVSELSQKKYTSFKNVQVLFSGSRNDNELVMCLLTNKLFDKNMSEVKADLYNQNIVFPEKYKDIIVFAERKLCENSPLFLQIIPYIILARKGLVKVSDNIMTNYGLYEYMVYRRVSGDKRLVDKYSIGVGGHITISDIITDSDGNINIIRTINNNIMRELKEEVGLTDSFIESINFINKNNINPGYVYSDKIDMNKWMSSCEINDLCNISNYHLPVPFIVLLKDNFKVKFSDEIRNGEYAFQSKNELKILSKNDKFETWSKYVVELLE